jgi:hypothetical protein
VAVALGTVVVLMLLASPVCHPHYLCHWLPLTVGLLAWDLERHETRGFSRKLLLVLVVTVIANGITSVPGLSILRDYGLATTAGLLLWATGIFTLKRWGCSPVANNSNHDSSIRAFKVYSGSSEFAHRPAEGELEQPVV